MTENITPEVRRQRKVLAAEVARRKAAAKRVVEWRERSSGEGYYATPKTKSIKELVGYLDLAEDYGDAFVGKICLRAGLRFVPVQFIAAMKRDAASKAVEDSLGEFAEEVKKVRWTKIDLTEVCEDGSPFWAFDPEFYEAVWRTEHYSGNAHIKQPKGSKKSLLTMNFEDRHFPTLRYQFDSLAEAKRVGSLIAACGGIPEDERYGVW